MNLLLKALLSLSLTFASLGSKPVWQVVGDRLVVSQSNYDASPFDFGSFDWEPDVPKTTGAQCAQQGWSLTAYAIKSGQQLWQFCPNAQQFPQLDLKLTHGMQFHLTADRVYLPLVMHSYPDKGVSDQLLSLDANTGTPAWSLQQPFQQAFPLDRDRRKVSSEQYGSSVISSGDRVVVLTGKLKASVRLQAFESMTGKAAWSRQLSDQLLAESIASGVVVRNYLLANQHQIFQISPKAGLSALKAQTGAVQFHLDGDFWGRTLVTETVLYQFGPTAIAAYETTTGKQLWRHPLAPPEGMDNYIGVGAVDQQTVYARIDQAPQKERNTTIQLLALERKNGQQKWQKQLEHPKNIEINIPPIVSEGGVSLLAANSSTSDQTDLRLVTLTAENGDVRWSFPLKIAGDHQAVVRVYGLITSNQAQIFVRDRAPRFHQWLAHFNLL